MATADSLFSWKSPAARPCVKQRGQLSDGRLLELMLAEPRLVRRPIVVSGRRIVIGLDEHALRELLRRSP